MGPKKWISSFFCIRRTGIISRSISLTNSGYSSISIQIKQSSINFSESSVKVSFHDSQLLHQDAQKLITNFLQKLIDSEYYLYLNLDN